MSIVAPDPALSPVFEEIVELPRHSPLARVLGFIRHQPLGTIGLVLVVIVAVAGLGANWIAPYDPTSNDFAAMIQA
ncbi:MAG: hypothetical protein ACREFN_04520, partial [Acetobacteraceae bacterium]